MSREGTQAVFGAAITDTAFCRALLECPAKALAGFDLTGEEYQALARIRAGNLQQFAAKFERWRLSKAVGRERFLAQCFPEDYAHQRLAG